VFLLPFVNIRAPKNSFRENTDLGRRFFPQGSCSLMYFNITRNRSASVRSVVANPVQDASRHPNKVKRLLKDARSSAATARSDHPKLLVDPRKRSNSGSS
jgi:hypothetical protein